MSNSRVWFGVALSLAGAGFASEPGSVTLPLAEYQQLTREPSALVNAKFTSCRFHLVEASPKSTLETTLVIATLGGAAGDVAVPDLGVLLGFEVLAGRATLTPGSPGDSRMVVTGGSATVRLRTIPEHSVGPATTTIQFSVPISPVNLLIAELASGRRVERSLESGEEVELDVQSLSVAPTDVPLLASLVEQRVYRIGKERLSILSYGELEIYRGQLASLTVDIPVGVEVKSARADEATVTGIRAVPDRPGRHEIRFDPPAETGRLSLYVIFERALVPGEATLSLPEIDYSGITRGELVIAVTSTGPLLVAPEGKPTGFDRIDERELPGWIGNTGVPVLYAARRVGNEAPSLNLRLSRFEPASVIAAVIDHARVLTVATADGRRIDRVRLDLQTSAPLFRLPLADGVEVWSVLLDQTPVRPLRDGRDLVVQLGRSSGRARSVEVVVASPDRLALPQKKGEITLAFPALPLPTTRVEWELYLPDDRDYRMSSEGSYELWSPPPPVNHLITKSGLESPSGSAISEEMIRNLPKGMNAATVLYSVSGAEAAATPTAPDRSGATGSLTGRVLDDTGGVLPGCAVNIRHPNGWLKLVYANANGEFMVSVPTGAVEVTVELQGFATTVVRNVQVRAGELTRVQPVLRPAGVQESMMVSSAALSARELLLDSISESDREALTRNRGAGVAAIPVSLPETGKRLVLERYLLLGDAPEVTLKVREARK